MMFSMRNYLSFCSFAPHDEQENVGLEDMELREDGVVPAHTHNPKNGRLLVPRLAVMREAIQGWVS